MLRQRAVSIKSAVQNANLEKAHLNRAFLGRAHLIDADLTKMRRGKGSHNPFQCVCNFPFLPTKTVIFELFAQLNQGDEIVPIGQQFEVLC